jgi:hypothetical protein
MKKIMQLLVAVSFLSIATVNTHAGEDEQTVWTDYGALSIDVDFPYSYYGTYTVYLSISGGATITLEMEYGYTFYTVTSNSGSYSVGVNNMGNCATVSVDGLPPGYYTVTVYTPTYTIPGLSVIGW